MMEESVLAKVFAGGVRGACACGTCRFEASAAPKARLICHCTICQSFTGRAYSDVAIYPAAKVRLHGEDQIAFRYYKNGRFPPPNLNRGRCKICDRPVVEVFGDGPLKILFVPAANFAQPERLPAPRGHLFYEHRQRDADDATPKYEHYLRSQTAILGMILHAI
jgi:hypothetical protein